MKLAGDQGLILKSQISKSSTCLCLFILPRGEIRQLFKSAFFFFLFFLPLSRGGRNISKKKSFWVTSCLYKVHNIYCTIWVNSWSIRLSRLSA